VLFGDGAAAAIVSSRVPSPAAITDTSFASDPSGQATVVIPTGGHFGQEGRTVQAFAIKTTADVVKALQEKVPADESRRQVFIGHQANLRMLENVCKRVGIGDENHYTNIANFGNTGAAGAPITLSQNWDALRNTVILMAVVGSGLAWGGMRITRE